MAAQKPRLGGAARAIALAAVSWLCLLGSAGAGERDFSTRLAAAAAGMEQREMQDDRDVFAAWLRRALAGNPEAAYRLARVYARGTGPGEDLGEAAHWFRKAAEAGHAPAQLGLARLYGKGQGVPLDYVQSYVWFSAAAENREYGMARDQALELRDMMAAFLTPDQRAEAERLAAEWRAER